MSDWFDDMTAAELNNFTLTNQIVVQNEEIEELEAEIEVLKSEMEEQK